jgi:hypothetical protein
MSSNDDSSRQNFIHRATRLPSSTPLAWGPLYYTNGQPTPEYEALMAEFFLRLDPQGTRSIKPETLSDFLDLLGFATQDNVWKANRTSNAMYTAEDMADFELKAACEAWNFDHQVVVRHPGHRQLPYGGMPLLSVRGFTDMLAVEHAADPDLAWRGLNAAMRQYGVWSNRGALPRQVLLTSMPPEVQNRINEVSVRSKNAALTRINANQARLMLEQQGQQNALDLLRDRRYVYYY